MVAPLPSQRQPIEVSARNRIGPASAPPISVMTTLRRGMGVAANFSGKTLWELGKSAILVGGILSLSGVGAVVTSSNSNLQTHTVIACGDMILGGILAIAGSFGSLLLGEGLKTLERK